jgi:superfamily II DNA or RNA helicase
LCSLKLIQLEIGNSYSRITGLSAAQEKELKKALSYTIGGSSSFFSGYGPRKKSLLDKKGYFPTGLLSRIPKYWNIAKDNRIQPTSKPQPFIISGEPYKWQVDAVRRAEATHRGIISAPTGTGKSMAMALLITRLNVKTLVVVPSLEIKFQLRAVLDKTNMPNIIVENIDSKALLTITGVDCLIIDEAHHVAAKTYQKLNKTIWKDIYYRFFFTATPFRNDTEEMLLFEAIAGGVIYKLDYKSAIKNGYIVPVEAYYLEIPKQKVDGYQYAEVYSEMVVHNDLRNQKIANLLMKLDIADKSTLCLVREVAHGKELANLTGYGFVSGEDADSRDLIRQFNDGGIKVLIGTEGILSEGVDTKPCEFVIVAGLGKAKSQLMQKIGRGVRNYPGKESCKVVLIRDASHRYLIKHYNIQKKVLLDEYQVIPVRLEV